MEQINLPKDPPIGLLMSMVMRYDHALGCPGYYDQEIFAIQGLTHQFRLNAAISLMRQLYEEVSLYGFYNPSKEDYYKALYEKAKLQTS